MALHRDIFWVGKQWAVTGAGVQAIDQRRRSGSDIEVSRVWDHDLPKRMRVHPWLNAEDFDKALEIARSRFPEPPRKPRSLVESVLELIQPAAEDPPPAIPPAPAELPEALPILPQLRAEGALARFLPQWRVRT